MSDMIRLEVNFFVTAFLSGIILLAFYDIIRVLRRIIYHNKFAVALEDMLFWAAGGIMVFYMMYEKNDGIIRGIALLSLFLGMALYHNTISSALVKWMYRLIGTPIKKTLNVVKKILKKVKKTVRMLHKDKEGAEEPVHGGQNGKE